MFYAAPISKHWQLAPEGSGVVQGADDTLSAFAPARCVLAALDYQHAALRHNGRALRDGKFNRGTA